MNIQLIKAAQARAATAVLMSNALLWDEAKVLYRIGSLWQDAPAMLGVTRSYRQVNTDDAGVNFEMYGDFIVCDGDKLKANPFINLDLPDEVFNKCDL